MEKKKSVPRYFDAKKKSPSPASVLGKSKTKGKFPKKKKSTDEEAIDIDVSENLANGDVDTDEISAFVKKLGLSNFSDGGPPVNSNSPSKSIKEKKKAKKIQPEATEAIKQNGDVKDKVNKMPKTNQAKQHLRFEDAESKTSSKKKNKKKRLEGDKAKPKTQRPSMILKPTGGKWFVDEETEVDAKIESVNSNHIRQEEIIQIHKNADGLLQADTQSYKAASSTGSNKSDFQWMEKMMKTGTLPDRMAAFIVRIQDSPVHNVYFLQQLLSMVRVQGKQQCMTTADTLRELFLEDLLPADRKLVEFNSRGVELKTATKKQLIKWAFEDKLKTLYSSYIEAVQRMAADTVEKLRAKGITIIYQLLVSHPEQEETLLQILVNKLGDPAKKLASRALFYLNKLLEEHPRMKRVVVDEVERLLFRNNISKRAQYYGICFLNLVDLVEEHASLAYKLITVYIAFFKGCIKTGDIDTKMMSGLLTGINRAFAQAREFGFEFSENLDTLYKIVQVSQFTISIQALSILFQITDVEANPTGADRFYRVLYEKLIVSEFKTSSHNAQFLNLIFKALKGDTNVDRVTGFVKRLLQVCQNCEANLACAILYLLSEVAKVHPKCIRLGNLSENEKQQKEINETELDSSDSEAEDKEAKENLKRTRDAALKELMKSTNINISVDNDEESNIYSKTKNESKKQTIEEIVKPELAKEEITELSKNNYSSESVDVKRILTDYDPMARNPSYCGAQMSLSHELMTLANHFHPSVALFAQTLINKKSIKYDGNPFKDFTLTRFLERFSYRNAKPSKQHIYQEYRPKGLRNVPVNSENYLSCQEDKIPVEEKFFYRFFKSKQVKTPEKDTEDTSDVESIGDDEFDDLMSNYFKQVKGNEGSDDDEDEEEDDDSDSGNVDFASGISTMKSSGGKKRKYDQDSASEDDDDEEEDEDEESDDGGDDGDEFISMDNDGDDESDDEDDFDMLEEEDETASLKKKKPKRMRGGDMFAPAEEFAEMLEENADEVLTGSQTLINKDKADKKQLKWETERDRWVKGFTGKSGGGKKKFHKKKARKS